MGFETLSLTSIEPPIQSETELALSTRTVIHLVQLSLHKWKLSTVLIYSTIQYIYLSMPCYA